MRPLHGLLANLLLVVHPYIRRLLMSMGSIKPLPQKHVCSNRAVVVTLWYSGCPGYQS